MYLDAVPATWAWDPYPTSTSFGAPEAFGFWGKSDEQIRAEDATRTIASNIRSEQQAVYAIANLFDRASLAATTPHTARAPLRIKAAEYREAAEAGAYDAERTRVGIGQVGWRSQARADQAIYGKIIARYQRAIDQLRQYGAPRWVEAFDSAVVGTQARADRVAETTWEAAAEQTARQGKKTFGWGLAAILPIALVAGAIWLTLTLAPAFTAWQAARAAEAQRAVANLWSW